MAHNVDSDYVHWVCPEMRGQLSIENLHISKSLKKAINKTSRSDNCDLSINRDFEAVIFGCAEQTTERPESWINNSIRSVFLKLHELGKAHSVEFWQNGELKGGLYGLAIGSAFFGESMFSRVPNASKICLVHLVARLWSGGFTLLDTQFVNDHLLQFGVYELLHDEYQIKLNKAVMKSADFVQQGKTQHEILENYFQMRDRKL